MIPKNKTISLVIAIIFLVISLPLAIYGTYYHFTNLTPKSTCDLKLNESFCYTCTNKDGYCNYAYNYVDDANYKLNYYNTAINNRVKLNNNYYAFITDDSNIDTTFNNDNTYLYNIANATKTKIAGVKNYGIGIDNNYVIVKNNDLKWGVLEIGENISIAIPYEYDYIGLHNELTPNNTLVSNTYVVLKNNKWFLIDNTNATKTIEYSYPIYDYNNTYVALVVDNKYQVISYSGDLLSYNNFDKVLFYNNYLAVVFNNLLYVYDLNTKIPITTDFNVVDTDIFSFSLNNNHTVLKLNEEIIATLD